MSPARRILAGQGEDLGALARFGADGGERLAAVADDPRDQREGFDIVDEGGLAPETGLRGEGRAEPRHAAATLDRRDQRGLLATDERAGAFLDRDAERVIAAEEVVTEPAAVLHLRERRAHAFEGVRVFMADVEDGVVRADGDRRRWPALR